MRPLPSILGTRSGRVDAFDEERGLGWIEGDDGQGYPFHCTSVADGSRTIAVGVRVRFAIGAGRLGRWEATAIAPGPAAGSSG